MAQITVTGKVTSKEMDNPLPGVSVVVQGTTTGTTTDQDGIYSIEVPGEDAVLEFTFVGMKAKKVQVADQRTINVVLEPDVVGLQEVVVTGYGAQRRRDLTGSVASVRADNIEGMNVESVQKAIQGRAAGVQVTASDGVPGGDVSIIVRGMGSFAANRPIWIVDGVEVQTGGMGYRSPSESILASLDFDDIESIDILKDAAATAIYGARGARGVIVVETKKGENKKTSFNFEFSNGFTQPIRVNPVMNGPQWAQWDYERYVNRYGTGSAQVISRLQTGADRGWYELNGDGTPNFNTTPSYDWQDEAYRQGNVLNARLSASGGNEKTKFYASLAHNNTEGHVIAYQFKRNNFRLNVDHMATDRLSFAAQLSANISDQNTTRLGGAWSSPVRASAGIPPVEPIYDEDGYRGYANAPKGVYGAYRTHFLNSADLDHNITRNMKNIANLNANWEVIDNLTFRSTLGLDYNQTEEEQWYDPRAGDGMSDNGTLRNYVHRAYSIQTTQTLNYNNTFADKHKLEGLAGFETWERTYRETSVRGANFPNPKMNVLDNAGSVEWYAGTETERATMGVFSRFNYTYDDKYLLTLTSRYDASSRFGSKKRWGFFPAAALGWRLSGEPFMAGMDDISNLLLKVSYGKAGSDAAGTYAALGLWSGGTNYMGTTGLYPTQLPNNFLTWEESRTLNLAVNFAAFNSRLMADIEVYKKWTESLLLDRPLPLSTGWNDITENVGQTLNQGFELTLRTANIENENFRWFTEINFSYVENEILKLLPGQEFFDSRTKVGRAINDRYIPLWAGVNPADGRPMYYDANNNITYNPTYDDRQWVGPEQPTNYGGITNNLEYGNFAASIFFQYSGGSYRYNSDARYWFCGTGDRNQFEWVFEDRWQEPGDMTYVPKPVYGNNYNGNVQSPRSYASHMYERVDYIRLKEVSLSYMIPSRLTRRFGVDKFQVFVRGSNLLTWTDYSGADPEFTGTDFGTYPIGQTITLGINTNF
jgi:TonB-linked SusC/RagA family outer membrane protein